LGYLKSASPLAASKGTSCLVQRGGALEKLGGERGRLNKTPALAPEPPWIGKGSAPECLAEKKSNLGQEEKRRKCGPA